MSDEQSVPDRLQARVFEALISFGAQEELMSRDATFDQLGVDSLDLVELAQIIETEFGPTLQQDDLQDIKTVGQAIDLIKSQLTQLPSS